MVEIGTLDRSARYKVEGWDGIAFRVAGFPKRWEPYTALVECQDADCACHEDPDRLHEEDTGEGEEVDQDETCGRVIVVMIGDDKRHEVDVEDLTKLKGSEYCHSCGQMGCGHDLRDEDDE